jgi:hypothetical protein
MFLLLLASLAVSLSLATTQKTTFILFNENTGEVDCKGSTNIMNLTLSYDLSGECTAGNLKSAHIVIDDVPMLYSYFHVTDSLLALYGDKKTCEADTLHKDQAVVWDCAAASRCYPAAASSTQQVTVKGMGVGGFVVDF